MAAKKWDDLTLAERTKYVSVYANTMESITEAIAHHRARLKDPNRTKKEESFIGKELPKLIYRQALIQAKKDARTLPTTSIKPPTAQQVKDAQKMAAATDALAQDMDGLKAGVKIASAALGLMSAVQAKPAKLQAS